MKNHLLDVLLTREISYNNCLELVRNNDKHMGSHVHSRQRQKVEGLSSLAASRCATLVKGARKKDSN